MKTPPLSPAAAPVRGNPFAPRTYGELHRVTDRVYIFRNITNSSFVVGDRSVAVIDTQVNRSTAQFLLNAVRSVTSKPISHAINTHYHWDHTNGNALFKGEGAVVVSSKLTREFMEKREPRQKEFLASRGFELGPDPFRPEMTFENETEIDLGGTALRLFFAGEAETDDATAVWVPSEGVLASGDTIMTGSFPIFGQPVWDEGLEGSGRWIRTVQKLLTLAPAHVIPGHGPLAQPEDIERFIRIQEYVVHEVGARVEKGWAPEIVLADLEPRLPEWILRLPLVWGTPRYAILRAYRSLTRMEGDPEPGWQKFKPSAIPAKDSRIVADKTRRSRSAADFIGAAHEAREGGDAALEIAVLERALREHPESADVHLAYAEALVTASRRESSVLEKGDFFERARRAWDRVLQKNPNHEGALLGKGRYLVMMAYRGGDDPSEGMRLLRSAAAQGGAGTRRAEIEFYLGMGHRRLGEEAQARAQFELALEWDVSFGPARVALS